jgi:hypothetical protein
MFDAIFCIHAMRDAHPALKTEYPFILFLAANPSGEEHIRNGKTGATVALVSAFAPAAPLVALFYMAWRLAGLPFVAFDIFDWLTRTLPGPVVTFGIDTIVGVIRGQSWGHTRRQPRR